MKPLYDWQNLKNILCVRADNLGDLLMTTPAIRALEESVPGRRITVLTSHMGSGVAKLIPEVADVMEFNAPWVKVGTNPVDAKALYNLINNIKKRRFDAAIIFNVYSQNPLPAALTLFLAEIPRRLAYCRENPYQLLTDWVPDPEPLKYIRHEVERQLDLVAAIGCTTENTKLSLRVPKPENLTTLQKLTTKGVEIKKPWLLLHCGVSEKKRQYPINLFAGAARKLVRELNCQIVVTGSKSEREDAEIIQKKGGGGVISLAGFLGLEELIRLISISPLLISNNTGPVHVAAALGIPVVVLYALTNTQHTPWRVPNRTLFFDVPKELRSESVFAYNGPKALSPVEPDDIVKAVKELLIETNGTNQNPKVYFSSPLLADPK